MASRSRRVFILCCIKGSSLSYGGQRIFEAKADDDGSIDIFDLVLGELVNVVANACLGNGVDLLAQGDGAESGSLDANVRGQSLLRLGGQVDNLQSGRELVVRFVADDDSRAATVLLAAGFVVFGQDVVNLTTVKTTVHRDSPFSQCRM